MLSTRTDMTTEPGNLITCKTPPRGVSAGSFKTFVMSCPGLCFRGATCVVRDIQQGAIHSDQVIKTKDRRQTRQESLILERV
jgi:hypothetical protein